MSSNLKGKNIVLGITGSIAAYKAAEIVRLLKERGAFVYPVMTKCATFFVHPTTFQTLSQQKVGIDLFEKDDISLKHISLSELADIILIAPATANIIGKIASGIADDLITTTVMAARSPVVIAPAMNERMYHNSIVKENISRLKSLGYKFIGPEVGRLASGAKGEGRMVSPQLIVDSLEKIFTSRKDLEGKSFIVTAGPTREPLDYVRFISNRSSGKMGFAIAEEARDRGAKIILISGPTLISPPGGVEFYSVETAKDMMEKVKEWFEKVDGLIMASAVSDFRPVEVKKGKIKKADKDKIVVKMVKNPDILEEMGKVKGEKILVGFCAETEDIVRYAKEKLIRKNLDFIVANNISFPGAGFGTDTNQVIILDRQGRIESLPIMSKREVASKIWDRVKELLNRKKTS